MRYVLAAIFICAVSMPAASALPTLKPNSLSASKENPIEQAAKRSRPRAPRHSRSSGSAGGDGGIHPLVGSGGY